LITQFRSNALAAADWEAVYERRLANVKAAVQLVAATNSENTVNQRTVNKLLENALTLEQGDLRLKGVEVKQ
jgi:hypothetical protein